MLTDHFSNPGQGHLAKSIQPSNLAILSCEKLGNTLRSYPAEARRTNRQCDTCSDHHHTSDQESTLRDAGCAAALNHTSQEWRKAADNAIAELAMSVQDFTAEDVRVLAGDPPHHPNAMGSVMIKAMRAG